MKKDPGTHMGIKALLFDLDGVLVDTARYHFKAWQKLAATLGISLDESDNDNLKGVGRMESLDYIIRRGKLEELPEDRHLLAERKNSWYLGYIDKMNSDEVLPGVLAFLDEAKENNLRLAVGSGSKNAMTVLERTGLLPYFEAVCDGNTLNQSKPHPEIFLNCCRELEIDPHTAVVFEDAQTGIEAARRAGCLAIGIGDPSVLDVADFCIPGFAQFGISDLFAALRRKGGQDK